MLCSVVAFLGVFAFANAQEIAFSIHQQPVIVQSQQHDFSIHQGKPQESASPIDFSVLRVNRELGSVGVGDAPSGGSPIEPNRAILFVTTKPIQQMIQQQVCCGNFCRWEWRTVETPPATSVAVRSELESLIKQKSSWKMSKDSSADSDFLLVDIDDPKNAELLVEYSISKKDCPVLVKEVDPSTKVSAAGMKANDLAEWWNGNKISELTRENVDTIRKFRSKKQPMTSAASQASVPEFKKSNNEWSFPGDIRSHLTDPGSPHHLPKAVIDSWSDADCVKWHNWHHEVLSGRQATLNFHKALPVA